MVDGNLQRLLAFARTNLGVKGFLDKIWCHCGILTHCNCVYDLHLTISRTIHHLGWAWTISLPPEHSSPSLSHLIYPLVPIPPLSAKDTCPFLFFLLPPDPCLIPLRILILVLSSPPNYPSRPDFARVVVVTFSGSPWLRVPPSSTKLPIPAISVLSTHMCLFGFYTFLVSTSTRSNFRPSDCHVSI